MTKLNTKWLIMFGLLALGLTISACIPGQSTNINQADDAVTEDKNDSTVEDSQTDDSMMKDGQIGDEAATEDKKDDSILRDDSEAMISEVKTFDLTGKNFAFSQSEIKVKKGDKVIINFKSTDGFHDWVIDEFNAKTSQVNTGGSASVEFVADQAGTFEFYCSVGRHREMGMSGKLIVE